MNGPDAAALARVGVLIVNYNSGPWLVRAVQAVRPDGAGEPAIVIVDNGSRDDSLAHLLAALSSIVELDRASMPASAAACPHPDPPPQAGEGRAGGMPESASVLLDRAGRNLGFAAGINRAARHCDREFDREFLLLLNPDCLITPAALARLIEELDTHPEAGLVSGKVVGTNGIEQRASRRRLPRPRRIVGETLPGVANGIDLSRTPAPEGSVEIEAVSGACMLVRAEAFRALGGMDEGYPLHFEDLDLFARLQEHGWRLRWVAGVEIIHAGGRSSSSRPLGVEIDKHRGLWRYLSRHCRGDWPAWQRPVWGAALFFHLALRLLQKLPSALAVRAGRG